MEVLPAIDLRCGKVVRLAQGDYARQTTYADDPAKVARDFASAGATWIHMVDLDAAKQRNVPEPAGTGEADTVAENRRAIQRVAQAVECRIELGGGARNDDAVRRMLELGASRIVIGSAALNDWPWFESLLCTGGMAEKLALGLDAKAGLLAAHGWQDVTELRATDLAARVKGSGLGAIVYTDIARDGMLQGVNVEATAQVVAATDVPVIASGGVGSLADIRACRQIGCGGVIVGRAYYEGKIDLAEAFAISREQGYI